MKDSSPLSSNSTSVTTATYFKRWRAYFYPMRYCERSIFLRNCCWSSSESLGSTCSMADHILSCGQLYHTVHCNFSVSGSILQCFALSVEAALFTLYIMMLFFYIFCDGTFSRYLHHVILRHSSIITDALPRAYLKLCI